MSLPQDPSLRSPSSPGAPGGPAPDASDPSPTGGRGQDSAPDEWVRTRADQPSRPPDDDEREAAERGPSQAGRVHAPASSRTPKPPAPGHEALVESTDATTPERRALPSDETTPAPPRAATTPESHALPPDETAATPPRAGRSPSGSIVLGASTGSLAAIGAAAAWRYTRWRQERNRPIARMRRRVRRAAGELGHRLPARGELTRYLPGNGRARPAGGLALGVVVAALLVNRTLRARAAPGHPPNGHASHGR
jgi:HAMP domain-containing protein